MNVCIVYHSRPSTMSFVSSVYHVPTIHVTQTGARQAELHISLNERSFPDGANVKLVRALHTALHMVSREQRAHPARRLSVRFQDGMRVFEDPGFTGGAEWILELERRLAAIRVQPTEPTGTLNPALFPPLRAQASAPLSDTPTLTQLLDADPVETLSVAPTTSN